jgi:chemotaxis protein histidine kinase CheA
MTNINVIAGATVLGDGSVALILDIATVMQTS